MVLAGSGGDPRPVEESELGRDALLAPPPPQTVPVDVDRGGLQQGELREEERHEHKHSGP